MLVFMVSMTAFAADPSPAHQDNAEDWSCGDTVLQGVIEKSNGGQRIPIDAASTVRLEHKQDVDIAEDRCITNVIIEHNPDRGCAYRMEFGVVANEPDLQLLNVEIGADSFCPGWRDWIETGDPNRRALKSFRAPGIPLSMSTRIVPDRAADESCTELSMRVNGEVMLAKLGRSPSKYTLRNIAVSGQFNSKGNPGAVCAVERKPVATAPTPLPQSPAGPKKRVPIALLVNAGTPQLPAIPGFALGVSALLELSARSTVGVSMQRHLTNAGTGGTRYVQYQHSLGDSSTMKPKAFVGLRVGTVSGVYDFDVGRVIPETAQDFEIRTDDTGDRFESWMEPSRVTVGPTIGVELSRARPSPGYASFDLAGFVYNEPHPVISTSFDGLDAVGLGVAATLRVGVFLGNRDQPK